MQQSVQDVSVVSGDQQINDGAVLRILQQRRRLALARQRPARMVRNSHPRSPPLKHRTADNSPSHFNVRFTPKSGHRNLAA